MNTKQYREKVIEIHSAAAVDFVAICLLILLLMQQQHDYIFLVIFFPIFIFFFFKQSWNEVLQKEMF